MSDAFTPPVRFSRLVLKVNAFLLIALLLVGAFLGLVAYKQGWFVPRSTVYFVTPTALGINRGMPVKLFGFTVGSVSRMSLAVDGVDVRLSIAAEHLPRIPKGSHARLAREASVVGASVIEIVPARGGPPLEAGDRIGFEASRGLSEIIDDIRRQAVPAFNEMKQVLSQINRSSGDVAALLAALRAEAERLPQTHRAMRELLEQGGRTTTEVGRQATETLRATQLATEALAQAVPRLAERLDTTLGSMEAAADELARTGRQAQAVLQRAEPVLERGEIAAREASEVLGAAKRVWPLSGSFSPPAEATLPIDSFEAQGAAPRP